MGYSTIGYSEHPMILTDEYSHSHSFLLVAAAAVATAVAVLLLKFSYLFIQPSNIYKQVLLQLLSFFQG